MIPVYCHMDSVGLGENGECGGGGWTLVMKIDGSKVKKHLHSVKCAPDIIISELN